MTDTLTITFTGLHSTEIARQRRALDIHMRNIEIRARYREMRGRGMSAGDAKSDLAKIYNLSIQTIHNILWPRQVMDDAV